MYCQQNWHEYNTKQDTTSFWALYKMTVDIKKKKSEGKEKKESKRRKKEKILLKGKGELQMDKKRLIYIIAQLIAAIKRFKSIPNKRIILLLMHVL